MYFIFCTVVLMSDLPVVLDAAEAKRDELGSYFEGARGAAARGLRAGHGSGTGWRERGRG